ncbi:hypothetical protein ZMO02_16820 [Zymomonas mobilis subsp. pomaceae]|nr:hypothetical protein ZMO02_16820 [Zymomonas mobilis subsp. pomaceae]
MDKDGRAAGDVDSVYIDNKGDDYSDHIDNRGDDGKVHPALKPVKKVK